jgi:hypothetical protein
MFGMAPADPASQPRRPERESAPTPTPAPTAPRHGPALEGDLAVFPTTDLFQFFALLGLSGTLELIREAPPGPERVCLHLVGGRLVDAETSGPRAYLGELLVRRYGVPIEAVIDSLQRQTSDRAQGRPTSRLGQLLIERQHLTEGVLRRALDDAVSRVAGPVLLWDAGSFAFWADPSPMVPAVHADRQPRAARAAPDACTPEVSLEELVLRRWSPGDSAKETAPRGGG